MLLQTKDIVKRFGTFNAVKGVSLEIEQGQVIGLLGPNGAGKSTTISMISTLVKPTEGDIFYNGQSILKNPKAIQKKMGIVPQNIALYKDLSGFENLKYWGMVYGLSGSQLHKRIQEVSEIIGIEERLKDPVKNYSGGMQRRINIGAALLHQPELLIMDEPTVGIDPQSRNHILSTVKMLNQLGMSIIYTSHYMEEVEYLCRQIYIMDEGTVIAKGDQETLTQMVSDHQMLHVSFETLEEQAVEILRKHPQVQSVSAQDFNLEMKVNAGGTVVSELLQEMTAMKLTLSAFEVKKPNLESVFLKLTGKALRD
jgi:ABC-2 type transport system ATP-binding protein